MTKTPSAEDPAAKAVNRRRAQGFFGQTDALQFILERYHTDLNDYLSDASVPGHGAAVAAVEIAAEVLRANHKAADKARKVRAEMDRVIEYAEANAAQNVPLFGLTIDLDHHAEVATAIAEVGGLLKSLDLVMGRGSLVDQG